MSKHANRDDYEESLMSIRGTDRMGPYLTEVRDKEERKYRRDADGGRDQGDRDLLTTERGSVKERRIESSVKSDLSRVENLRPRSKDHPSEKAFHHERTERSKFPPRHTDRDRVYTKSTETSAKNGSLHSQNVYATNSRYENGINNAYSSSKHRSKYFDDDAQDGRTMPTRSSAPTISIHLPSALNTSEDSFKIETRFSADFLDRQRPKSPYEREKMAQTNKPEDVRKQVEDSARSRKVEEIKQEEIKRPTIRSPRSKSVSNKSLATSKNVSFQNLPYLNKVL